MAHIWRQNWRQNWRH